MGFRQDVRDDFPPGWWRSAAWWRAGFVDMGTRTLIVIASALMPRRIRTALRARCIPTQLAPLDDLLDAYLAAVLVNLGACAAATWWLGTGSPHVLVVVAVAAYAIVNTVAALIVIITVSRSRLTQAAEWAVLDYIDRHAPRRGRPPETIAEYDAERLKNH